MRAITVCITTLLCSLCVMVPPVCSQSLPGKPVPFSIIIDDMGNNLSLGQRALNLPGNISFSFLPNTPFAAALAEAAYQQGKQVLLHLPMYGHQVDIIEPDALSADMSAEVFNRLLQKHIAAIPHLTGVNNHMGSTVTPYRIVMDRVMQELATRNLFFVDSRTTHLTVAAVSAKEFNVPFAQRDVFLDNVKTEQSIRNAFNRFIRIAKERDGAIAIAHPHALTLSVLEKLLPEAESLQMQLVQASELTTLQNPVRFAEKD